MPIAQIPRPRIKHDRSLIALIQIIFVVALIQVMLVVVVSFATVFVLRELQVMRYSSMNECKRVKGRSIAGS